MIIDLEKLSESSSKITGEEKINVEVVADSDQQVSCRVEVTARKSGEVFYFNIEIEGSLATQCHKCLRPTAHDVKTRFDMVVHRGGADKAREDETEIDDFVYIPVGEKQFSLDQYLYENLIVNIPMRIVCGEDCRGLCPNCGVNLNEETCNCGPAVDSRWEALATLKKKLPKSK